MKHRNLWKRVALGALLVLCISIASQELKAKGCPASAEGAGQSDQIEILLLKGDAAIDRCEERGLKDRVVLITSRYCPHCKKVKPIIEQIVKERGLQPIYESVDITESDGRKRLQALKLRVQFVPTLIAGCQAYVGEKQKAQYETVLGGGKSR